MLTVFLDGVKMDGSFGSMELFCQRKWLKTKGDKHNDPEDPYHMDPNEVVAICKSIDLEKQLVHLNMTTPLNPFNLLWALASGWRVTIADDFLYALCKNNLV